MHQWNLEALEPRRRYTPMQAARATAVPPAEIGIHPNTMRKWHHRGLLPKIDSSPILRFTGLWLKTAADQAGKRLGGKEDES